MLAIQRRAGRPEQSRRRCRPRCSRWWSTRTASTSRDHSRRAEPPCRRRRPPADPVARPHRRRVVTSGPDSTDRFAELAAARRAWPASWTRRSRFTHPNPRTIATFDARTTKTTHDRPAGFGVGIWLLERARRAARVSAGRARHRHRVRAPRSATSQPRIKAVVANRIETPRRTTLTLRQAPASRWSST